MPALSRRQRRFVDEYLIDLNGSAAARRMGILPATAGSAASRMLRHKAVRNAIEQEMARHAAACRIKRATVLGEYARVAFFDPGRLVDENGEPLGLHVLDPDTRAGLGAVEVVSLEATARAPAQRRLRARPGEKVRALGALMKHLDLAEPAPPKGRRVRDDAPAALTDSERAVRITKILNEAMARRDREEAEDTAAGRPGARRPTGWEHVEAFERAKALAEAARGEG